VIATLARLVNRLQQIALLKRENPPMNRTTKRILPSFAIILLLTPLAATQAADSKPTKPNILIILADDLGRGDYSAFGTKDIRTPNIDRLCREGMEFQNFYANCCVCSPSRASLLSGCYPDRVGVPGVIRGEEPNNSWGYLAPHAVLLPKYLKPAGYHSAIVGKWHLGLTAPNTPNQRGFDFFHGFLGDMMDDYWTHLRHKQNFMRRNAEVVSPQGHATDVFTEWACQYLDERSKSPEPNGTWTSVTAL
jgi:arylsulfatase A-like enzyme